MKHLLISCLLILFASTSASSQNFNYTIAADSAGWNELNSQTILNTNNSAWNFSYKIPIGFSFNYLGQAFDSLVIETNGYLVFDNEGYYAFTAFNDFGDHIDNSGNHAVIGYELSGNAGNQILKIQYKDAGLYAHDCRIQSWQIWLKENGNIVEVHVGAGNYRYHMKQYLVADSAETVDSLEQVVISHFYRSEGQCQADSSRYCRIGLLNKNMDTETRGLFISGSTSDPTSEPATENSPETAFMITIPNEGYRYIFTPSNQ